MERLNYDKEFLELIHEFLTSDNYLKLKEYKQHGNTSCFDHSITVAWFCYSYAKENNEKNYNIKALVRGAMLHDYFLYDWHAKGHPKLHGFRHPAKSFINAKKHFSVNRIERDIIKKHMWPLTFFSIPLTKEAWLVQKIDKKVSIQEMKQAKYEKNYLRYLR